MYVMIWDVIEHILEVLYAVLPLYETQIRGSRVLPLTVYLGLSLL